LENEHTINRSTTGFLLLLFIACSFLVFNVGGYNNFIPADMLLYTRLAVVGVLLVPTVILYQSQGRGKKYWKISFSFLIASIGLLLAWIFGRWYHLIPGLSTSTLEGAAVAKFAEVFPIILTILVGMWLVERDFAPIFVVGGDLKKSMKLGLMVAPLGLIPFIALGGFALSVGPDVLLSWIPWMCIFAVSNAFMEELMIRGIFLKKFEPLFGQKQSLILTSLVFAIFHQAIIGFSDIVTFSTYMGIAFLLGIAWGYVMQKSDNIWGSVLAHTIADILFVIAVFGV